MRHYYGELNVKQRNFVWIFYFANITVTEIDLDNTIWNIDGGSGLRLNDGLFVKL